jgi:phospholipase/lecithinase/hemolysin
MKAIIGGALALALGLGLLGLPAQAATYTSAYFFGDSLTDPGNLYAATDGQVPPAPYWQGRSSNGPVWAEHVAEGFAEKGLETRNYAHAFAGATEIDDLALGRPFQAPDLPDQLAAFEAGGTATGRRPVAALWFGANDVLGAMATNPTAQAVGGAATGAANAVADGIERLGRAGVHDVVVFNLPPLDLTPRFFETAAQPLARLGSETFNAALAGRIADFGTETRVALVDIHSALADLHDNPQRYGVSDARTPCFDGATVCSGTEVLSRAFFDSIHPNSVVHSGIADLAGGKIAPVPLPAPGLLLLAGVAALAGFGTLRRNQRAAAA